MLTIGFRLIIAAMLALPAAAAAEDFAARPIRMIVAFAPGGTTDFVARLVAERASAALGRSIVVENKPGRERRHCGRNDRQG